MKIVAPTRIDLAGGTLDIFPLYVFEEGGITINMAINLFTEVELTQRSDTKININSSDLGIQKSASSIKDLESDGDLDLITRAIKFFNPPFGMDITTNSSVPKGSGLAASSSLLVALMMGLSKLCLKSSNPNTFIDWCANVEAQSLRIPTGKQDYYSAYYGGLSAINFLPSGIDHESLKMSRLFLKKISESVILSFTGISHFSGTNNWNMMKSYIDGNDITKKSMKQIKETSVQMLQAIKNESLKDIAQALNREWENRKQLADGVTNEKIDTIMSEAKKQGALASKICGAGGGGCMITVCDPENKTKITQAISDAGAQILNFDISLEGVKIFEFPS